MLTKRKKNFQNTTNDRMTHCNISRCKEIITLMLMAYYMFIAKIQNLKILTR